MLKEGVARGPRPTATTHRCRCCASPAPARRDDEPTVSLAEYVARMKPGQERIYYVIADSLAAARAQPAHRAAEGARARGAAARRAHRRVGHGPAATTSRASASRTPRAATSSSGTLAERRRPQAARSGAQGEQGRCSSASRTPSASASPRCGSASASRIRRRAWCSASTTWPRSMRRILAAAGQKAPEVQPGARAQRRPPAGEVPGRRSRTRREFAELAQLLFDQAALAEGGQLANRARVRAAPQPPAGAARRARRAGGLSWW